MEYVPMKVIAKLYCDYNEKFGIPRQSGMVENVIGKIIFEKEYRNSSAFRGLEGYSHIWLLWEFSKAIREEWLPTVRPPRLGGNKRMGVFATRSPFRPNAIGLSAVKIDRIDLNTKDGPVIYVCGADLMNGTPIFDIKPYLPYADCCEARGGFGEPMVKHRLEVKIPSCLMEQIEKDKMEAVKEVLSLDPRPAYQDDEERIYKLAFGGWDIHFSVNGNVLTVTDIFDRKEMQDGK